MGSPKNETDREGDEYQHKVTITTAFYMQTTEVTQGQWRAVMGTALWGGQEFTPYLKEGSLYPAMYVSWDNASAFCRKLSETEGNRYRLPTEAEWEYACRADTKTTWSFGNDENKLGDYAWYYENAFAVREQYAHQVRLKDPNAFGLYDMYGNVWEWCSDYYAGDYYAQSPVNDPTGPTSGTFRVVRGGSWGRHAGLTRPANRSRGAANDRNDYRRGFRVVRALD